MIVLIIAAGMLLAVCCQSAANFLELSSLFLALYFFCGATAAMFPGPLDELPSHA